jgi:hypothetical protein
VKFINVVLSPEPLKITIMKLKKIFSTPQRFFAIGSLTLALLIGFASCKKENFLTDAGTQLVTLKMNDDPITDLTNVWIDIQYVEVKIDTADARGHHHDDDFYDGDKDDDDDHKGGRDEYGYWDTLTITPGLYDVLSLRNGLDTTLAKDQRLPKGRIHKIRMTLGSNSAVSKDSGITRIPLTNCSNSPYVYVLLKNEHMDEHGVDQFEINLDFDLKNSIKEDNGGYCLKPVVKPYSKKSTGKIEGIVLPKDALALPMAYNSTDTAYAKPDEDGEFKICGLKPGTYTVKFNPSNGYIDKTIDNVVVTAGEEAELGKVVLTK